MYINHQCHDIFPNAYQITAISHHQHFVEGSVITQLHLKKISSTTLKHISDEDLTTPQILKFCSTVFPVRKTYPAPTATTTVATKNNIGTSHPPLA